MLKVLINAYAICPNMGSEQGMAWNWCSNLAKYCELYIITEEEYRTQIEKSIAVLPQGKNMHFYWNAVTPEVRQMCWNQGDWRFYKYYNEWQLRTLEISKSIVSKEHIDILHQLNMIGFRQPGYLWRIPNIPFVWGPTDAKEGFPTTYFKALSIKQRLFFRLKTAITKWQLGHNAQVEGAARRASLIIGASSESVQSFKKYKNLQAILLNETGCTLSNNFTIHPVMKPSDELNLLWVGKMDARKMLSLALNTMSRLLDLNVKLHIVGGGDNISYKMRSFELEINNNCIWHGAVSHEEVQNLMKKSDLLFFTSVAEGTPHVILEAIANGLPVLCHNCCGHGDSVDNRVGRKIELSNPETSVHEFAKIIRHLYNHREEIHEMSKNCFEVANELSWDNKAKKMVDLYSQVLQNRK